jgi:O-antigen ligase
VLKQNRLVIGTGLLFLLLSLGHIPVKIFPHAFDKNAPVHFVLLMLIAIAYSVYIVIRRNRFELPIKVIGLIWFLVIAVIISALRSPDLIGSLTGDSGRFTGVVSLFCLIVVAVFHSQFKLEQIHKLVQIFVTAIFIISVLGILQKFNVIELPGDTGVTGTLGNLDFFGAFVGTGFALFVYILPTVPRKRQYLFGLFILVELYAVYLAGPLQAFVDIGIIAIAIAVFWYRDYIPKYDLSLNGKTFFGTLGIIIWLEGIFLMPFIGTFIPVLGNDIQVRIRGQFWLAATRQFISSPLPGVGPDQYGSYYEKYRTVLSVQENPTLLANDAHAAPAQTLATLGILGTLGFVLLLALLVRAFFILDQRNRHNRYKYAAIGLYLFVFTTNAAISPITLPHKYLFWALAGFIIGDAYRGSVVTLNNKYKVVSGALIPVLVLPTLFVLVNFVPAQLKFLLANERYAQNQTQKIDLTYSNFLPCLIYNSNIAAILNKQSEKELIIFSQEQIKGNPYCIDAWLNLAKIAYNQGDLPVMRQVIYKLIEIAPSRGEVINLAALYANKAGDKSLDDLVDKQLMKFHPGLIIVK